MKNQILRDIIAPTLYAKTDVRIGGASGGPGTLFYKHEPVFSFNFIQSATLADSSSPVEVRAGSGNSIIATLQGDRTTTIEFTDAVFTPLTLAMLTGATYAEANNTDSHVHVPQSYRTTATVTASGIEADVTANLYIGLDATNKAVYEIPCEGYSTNINFGIVVDGDEVIGRLRKGAWSIGTPNPTTGVNTYKIVFPNTLSLATGTTLDLEVYYYIVRVAHATQLTVTPDSVGGSFYMTGKTRTMDLKSKAYTETYVIIPSLQITTDLSLAFSASGDPTPFTFNCNINPDYTLFNKSEKVLYEIINVEDMAPYLGAAAGTFVAPQYIEPAAAASAASDAHVDTPPNDVADI